MVDFFDFYDGVLPLPVKAEGIAFPNQVNAVPFHIKQSQPAADDASHDKRRRLRVLQRSELSPSLIVRLRFLLHEIADLEGISAELRDGGLTGQIRLERI